jgi:hypothetical protein
MEDQIFINELYVVSNMDTAVFVGIDGDPLSGTFQISLPPNAHSISFERGFSNFDSFIPAEEIIQTPTGFADTLPIRPGQGSLNLLVGYGMPYQPGMTIAHAVNYEVQQASIAMPQTGVTIRRGLAAPGTARHGHQHRSQLCQSPTGHYRQYLLYALKDTRSR